MWGKPIVWYLELLENIPFLPKLIMAVSRGVINLPVHVWYHFLVYDHQKWKFSKANYLTMFLSMRIRFSHSAPSRFIYARYVKECLKICSLGDSKENWVKHSRNSKIRHSGDVLFLSWGFVGTAYLYSYISLLFRVPYYLLRLASALFISLRALLKYSKCKLHEL